MKRRLASFKADPVEINVSPLIDMVFILLIFFIVATSFVNEIGLTPKHRDTAEPTHKLDPPVAFDLTGEGRILNKGAEVALAGVAPVVRAASARKPKPVILRVNRGAKAGLATRVMDQAMLGGAKTVKLSAVAASSRQ
ncbi:MAG: biopolymer transporter ExbD [Opitutales bacterium]